MNIDDHILELAQSVLDQARIRDIKLVTAESCTGGFIAAILTSLSGSSDVVYGGFITYANEAKESMIGVKETTLINNGAVSVEVAGEMAVGALERSDADIAIAVTGVAGPTGGSTKKPVGTVCFGLAYRDEILTEKQVFDLSDRHAIRIKTVEHALKMTLNVMSAD